MTLIQQPDALSFSGNLKKFVFSATETTPFSLMMGQTLLLTSYYHPGLDGRIEIDLREIVEKQLSLVIPTDASIQTDQTTGVADFTAHIGMDPYEFRVIKGGVKGLDEMAEDFVEDHFLSWQPQHKMIVQDAPEWLGFYPIAAGNIRITGYYADGSSHTATYLSPTVDYLISINLSWAVVSAFMVAQGKSDQVLAWDVWYEVSSVRTTPVQRYQLRADGPSENIFLWCNTLGGIDSYSFTGENEQDPKLEHRIAILVDDTAMEYDIDSTREIRQSTGLLDMQERMWIEDFFYSRSKYVIRDDGAVTRIAMVSSKILIPSSNDMFEFEFSYRLCADDQLLNLDRTMTDLSAPEGLTDFFLSELLSGLTAAQYAGNLNLAVQSPYAAGWQRISFNELWNAALPTLVDGLTVLFNNGKLRTNSGAIIDGLKQKHGFESPLESELSFADSTRTFSITALLDPAEIRVWNMGALLIKETESIDIENTQGLWYIYYKDVEQLDHSIVSTLMATTTSWDRDRDIPIATVLWHDGAGTVTDCRYLFQEVNHTPLVRFQDKPHPAEDVYTAEAGFEGILDETDTDVLKALKKLSKHLYYEQPLIGTIDNSNCTFTTTFQYVAGSTIVFRNGLEEDGDNYTELDPLITPKAIQFSVAPRNDGFTDKLKIRYIKI